MAEDRSSSTTHADKAGLTSGDDWAGVGPDGNNIGGRKPSPADVAVAKLGSPVYTSCCPTGTLEFLRKRENKNEEKKGGVGEEEEIFEGCCSAVLATLRALTIRMSTHPPKFLILSGSLRADSDSRKVAVEAGRILASYGATVKLFDPKDLPLFSADVKDPNSIPKVKELRALTRWAEGMVWVSPEVHGNFSAVFKNQVDWMPLTEGALRPTQGKTLAVLQVNAGSQSFNTVNNLRVLGRWMRMVCIPNQSSIPKAYNEFNEDGSLKDSSLRNRVVDVVEELFKYTLLLRDQQPYLLARYGEKRAMQERHLKQTKSMASGAVLRSLVKPIILDVRSEKEVAAEKGGKKLAGSINVPLNVDGNPQSVHRTTAEEFRAKLREAGVALSQLSKEETAFIAHCTKGNTDYIGRGARAAALLRDMGFVSSYNGGSADEIRTALAS